HEHPDHFSVPTLRGLDENFKKRVTVLFQKRNSDKIFNAMRGWGFTKFLDLPNRSDVPVGSKVSVNCYQVGLLDSVLVIRDGSEIAININDADLSESDLRYLKNVAAKPGLVLNQFSVAGYDGYSDREGALRQAASQKIAGMLKAHRLLEAEATLPF